MSQKANSTKSWNDESGDWQGLALARQVPRYRVIARMIGQYCPNGSVLDVGAGEAVLWDYLPKSVKYLGIEPSAKAVKSAGARCGRDCIIHSTGEDFDAGNSQWDCIVFNEMLYYVPEPVALLEKFSKLLKSGGTIIVSIYQKSSYPIKTRLMQWLHGRSLMSNVRCAKMVHDFMVRDGWLIEEDQLIVSPGSPERWQLWLARPRRP